MSPLPREITEKDQARFWSKVALPNEQGCMSWLDRPTRGGYGKLHIGGRGGRVIYAHRISYVLAYGPIPEGLVIDHLCRRRACVNAVHLEAVTQRENLLRGTGTAAINAAKTHCPAGHPYDEVNTYRSPCGTRGCRACKRDWMREHGSRKAGQQ
jgi:hypothetical protein